MATDKASTTNLAQHTNNLMQRAKNPTFYKLLDQLINSSIGKSEQQKILGQQLAQQRIEAQPVQATGGPNMYRGFTPNFDNTELLKVLIGGGSQDANILRAFFAATK